MKYCLLGDDINHGIGNYVFDVAIIDLGALFITTTTTANMMSFILLECLNVMWISSMRDIPKASSMIIW